VLDGDSLWLAVTGTRERIGVRLEGTRQILEPDNDAPADPTYTSLRWHLPSCLPGEEAATFEVVTLPAGEPVRVSSLPDPAPMRTPTSRDGRWHFDVRRREGGALVVRREPRERAPEVSAVRLEDDAVVLTLNVPALGEGHGAPQLLLKDGASIVSRLPVTRQGDLLTAHVRADDVPPDEGGHWLLALGSDTRSVPVIRSRNDNTAPGRSTMLPLLLGEEVENQSRVRFHYQAGGRLRVQRPVSTGSTTETSDPSGDRDDGGDA